MGRGQSFEANTTDAASGMLRRVRSRLGATLLLVTLVSSSVAAQSETDERARSPDPEPTEALVLHFEAPTDCPSRDVFVRNVRALTHAATFDASPDDERARVLSIVVGSDADGHRGTLSLVEGETRATREFEAATCAEVVEALALATALALDPDALSGAAEKSDPSPDDPPPEEVTLEEDPDRKDGKWDGDAGTRDAHRQEDEWAGVLGLRGAVAFPFARVRASVDDEAVNLERFVRPSGSIYLELEGNLIGAWTSVDAEVGYAQATVGEVALRWEPMMKVGICPLWWQARGWLRLAPCTRVMGGRLFGRPTTDDYNLPGETRRASAQPIAATIYFLARAQALLGNLRVSVEVGAVAPVAENPRVVLGPDGPETLMTLTRHVAPEVGLGLGWQLF